MAPFSTMIFEDFGIASIKWVNARVDNNMISGLSS